MRVSLLSGAQRKRDSYPDALVARVKAAHALGMSCKGLSRIAEAPYATVREWLCSKRRSSIAVDQETKRRLIALIQKGQP